MGRPSPKPVVIGGASAPEAVERSASLRVGHAGFLVGDVELDHVLGVGAVRVMVNPEGATSMALAYDGALARGVWGVSTEVDPGSAEVEVGVLRVERLV